MAEIDSDKVERALASIRLELDEFVERYEAGQDILQAEWDNLDDDWRVCLIVRADFLVDHMASLTGSQKEEVAGVFSQIRKIKPWILEKKWVYPEFIDQIEIS